MLGMDLGWDTVFVFCVFVLACHRITRFVLRDCLPVVAVPRDWLLRNTDPTALDVNAGYKKRGVFLRSVGYLFQCEWCMAVWVTGLAVIGTWFVGLYGHSQYSWVMAVMWWLSSASLVSLIIERAELEYDGCE